MPLLAIAAGTIAAAIPAPVIVSLSPTSAFQGSAAFTLTVNGCGATLKLAVLDITGGDGKTSKLTAWTPIVPTVPSTFAKLFGQTAASPWRRVSEPVVSYLPMYFAFPFVRGHFSYSQAAAFHAGTGVVADMDHPAMATETLEIYGVGLGVTNPMVDAGVARRHRRWRGACKRRWCRSAGETRRSRSRGWCLDLRE